MTTQLDTTSYWIDSASLQKFKALAAKDTADVVVIGAGIAGLTTAYLLASAGASVIVLERGHVAQAETGHTSGHLTMAIDTRLSALVKRFGIAHAQAVWDAGLASIAQIEEIVRAEDIDCGFARVPGYLHAPVAGSPDEAKGLREEAQLAEDLGFDATFVEQVPLVGSGGMRLENQARFHPARYLAGLAEAVVRKGGRICERSAVTEFSEQPRSVESNGHVVTAGYTVVATHTPLLGTRRLVDATLFQTKLALYSTYVVAGRVTKGTMPDALMWDTADPYHYYRLQPEEDHDLVIYGGHDHKTGQESDTLDRFVRLEAELRGLCPGVDIAYRWSGQVVESHDGLPFIGEQAPREFSGTGYAGNGLTFGTLTAMMAADSFHGRRNPWSGLFDVERSTVRGGFFDYLKENSDYPYYIVRDRFAGTEGKSLRAVGKGEGKVIDYRGQPVAASRDDHGAASLCSAVCTHMGCLVAWNPAERTWDCPCHGSRFTTSGAVMSGPAETPLTPVARK